MDSAALLAQVENVARQAGDFIRREREHFSSTSVEIKGLNDLVSYVDKEAERMIVEGLSGLLPDAGFIVEENTRSGKKETNWIVDPLDGTTNFVHNIPSYAVSIALEQKGKIMAGVVYEISHDECYSAYRGMGASMNGKTIRVSERATIADSLFATGFPVQNFERIDPFLKSLEVFMRQSRGVRRIGAAAVDLCYLACGKFDGFFEYNLKPWDVAAGALIAEEAGGEIFDFSGGPNWLFGKEIVCTNGRITDEMMSVIQREFNS